MKSNINYYDGFLRMLIVISVLFVVLYFYKLGSTGLIDVDEPRYAEAGREMLESGNWIVPYFNYEARYDKPVFFYWVEAVSMKIFGVNEFAARFPSVLFSLLCCTMTFLFLRTFYELKSALLGTLVLMSSFEFAALARFSITDMTLCSLITGSIFSFYLGYNQIINSHRIFKFQIKEFSGWYIAGFIFLAFAVLTKGPVAVLILGIIFLPFFLWIEKLEYAYKNKSFWIGFLLFLAIAFPWYVLAHFKTDGEFTKVFLGLHNLSRYTSVVSGHKGSNLYFIPVILFGFLPWTFFLFQAIGAIFNTGLRSLVLSSKEGVPWFCLWWFLIVFLFFSFSKTKLLTYILPLFPALAVIIAFYFDQIFKNKISANGLTIGLGVFFVFLLAVLYVCFFKLNLILPREIKDLHLGLPILLFTFLLLVGIAMALTSSYQNEKLTISIILITFFLFYFSLVTFFLPNIDRHSQAMLRNFAKRMPKDVTVATYKVIKPSLVFYSKRKVIQYDLIEDIQVHLDGAEKFAFLAKKKLLKGIKLENAYKLRENNRYVFYGNYNSDINRKFKQSTSG